MESLSIAIVLLLIIVCFLIIINPFISLETEEDESDTMQKEDRYIENSKKLDELPDLDNLEHSPDNKELGDESWRRKQSQGSIEDRRGPGRL